MVLSWHRHHQHAMRKVERLRANRTEIWARIAIKMLHRFVCIYIYTYVCVCEWQWIEELKGARNWMCDVIPFERKHFPLECTVQSDIEFIDLKMFSVLCFFFSGRFVFPVRLCPPSHTDEANRSDCMFLVISMKRQSAFHQGVASQKHQMTPL